ncbi:hypothetical protein VL04_01135 [Chromobacterium violaceum]|uniref:Flagellar protein FliT n=1 Tax=Chromobacterium violaceum TaxID=536 RepID=A0A202BED7_CHRVL|nr:hypothetical protein [Chromobacterium violaceum]KMN47857.1 hypothetical protein VK93_18855 [Chromobacterium violaceum]KMN86647.1 hypothetical protein VL02_08030 [Chromobacterium violaceum]KMN92138.1 hypothetical protein VL04_01135 [Chromobacterium violaceum]KMO04119.1 hypothetical protein VL16_09695 [Chromobacterium violaceum]MBA8736788.1 hypothetical protein [Chromobacterium violaceum]
MPRPDVQRWCQAIAEAVGRRDWDALTVLDERLRRLLSEPGHGLDADDRAALAAAYRAALAASGAELDALGEKMSAIGQQREGRLAYAQFSEWEQA